MTSQEAIDAVRLGQRCETRTTTHGLTPPLNPKMPCQHFWRTVACNDLDDVVECHLCGEQRLVKCNFDDDFS